MSASVERSQEGIKLSGTLVFSSVSKVWDESTLILKTMTISDSNNTLTFDCSEVSHIDSAGIALMIEWKKWSKQHQKECQFLGLQAQATTLIKTYKLEKILN